MSVLLATVTLAHASGEIRDNVVNDWVFSTATTPATSDERDDIFAALVDFYNGSVAAHNSVANWIADSITRTALAHTIKLYDITTHLDGTDHGSPIAAAEWTLSAMVSGGQNMPNEMAAALSFHSSYSGVPEFGEATGGGGGKTRPRARRRGRIYIGPLVYSCLEEHSTSHKMQYTQSFMETLTTQAKDLMDASDVDWCTWSRVDGAIHSVVTAWCDNAVDIQRRRGEEATAEVVTTASSLLLSDARGFTTAGVRH